jgi:hypothetical protein
MFNIDANKLKKIEKEKGAVKLPYFVGRCPTCEFCKNDHKCDKFISLKLKTQQLHREWVIEICNAWNLKTSIIQSFAKNNNSSPKQEQIKKFH